MRDRERKGGRGGERDRRRERARAQCAVSRLLRYAKFLKAIQLKSSKSSSILIFDVSSSTLKHLKYHTFENEPVGRFCAAGNINFELYRVLKINS